MKDTHLNPNPILCLETGIYEVLCEQERIYPVYDMGGIEYEIHIMICDPYIIIEKQFSADLIINTDVSLGNMDKISFLMYTEDTTRNSAKVCILNLT